MENVTLREVCESLSVSRRAVQGYEKAGLVAASGKNERGYLLYDADSRERIKQIKLFQELGFTVREITDIIDAPPPVLKVALEKQVEKLEEDALHMEDLIATAHAWIERL